MMNAEDLTENIVDSTESIEGFKNIAPDLIRELFLGPKSNIRTFINVVSSILTSDDESPMNKFYGLYLLLKTCEGNPNDIFIDELGSKEELIAEIFKTAQFDASKKGASLEKGKTYFSESPSEEEACIGINYVRLAIEVMVYCGTHFGTQDMTESNYNFWFKMESLAKRMQLPSTYWFIEKNYYGDEEVASWNFNTKPLPFTQTNASTSTKPTIQPTQPTPIANITSIPTSNITTSQKTVSSQYTSIPTANIITSQKVTSSQPSAIPTANITTSQKIVSSQPTPTTPTSSNPLKISAFDKLNDPKMKSRNDLSTTSANVSLLDDKSMEKKTLGMRMAEMGMFTDDKRQRSRSPTPTAASRREKTPDKTQDIRNFFNEREKAAAQQTKTTPVKSWQSIDTNLPDQKAINEPPKSNQSIPTHSHQSSRQISDIPQDPFSRGVPETRGRERVQASYASNDRMYNEDRVKSNVMPNTGYAQERKETSPYLKEGAGAGWNGFERVNPKPTTPRSGAQAQAQFQSQSQQIQQGFDFNRADNRNMGTSDDSVYKEKYRAATAENENMKRENSFLKDELERLKKELYAKTTNEENLVKENRSLKAEVNHFQSQRGDRSEALTRDNGLLKSKLAEYEQRLGDMNNHLTAISYENKQLKASLEEKERELEESRDVPVRHVVFPGSNPFFTPEPQVQERRNDPPVSVPVLGGGYQSKGPYTLGAYNTPERFNQYPEGGPSMYGGDVGRRGDEGMFFSGGMEQGAGAGKKGIFERVQYDKPGMVLSKDNPYYK